MSLLQPSRRDFLKAAGVVGGGLVLSVPLSARADLPPNISPGEGSYSHDAFIQIANDGRVHFYMPRSEMGQGVYSSLATLIAEELSTPPEDISVHLAQVHEAYAGPENGLQSTGGSASMRTFYAPLRQTAANAREAIALAAAEKLQVPRESLTLAGGRVVSGGQSYSFGDFAALANTRPIPEMAPLTPAGSFQFIGKERSRIDAGPKVDGTALFGIDVDFPGLKRAVLKRCPVAGGRVKSFDATAAGAMPGVLKVVQIDSGVAVVAERYWQARQAADQLEVSWEMPELVGLSTDKHLDELRQQLTEEKGDRSHKDGEGADGLDGASEIHTAEYSAPFLAHATMEPMNCAVKIEGDRAEVWTGTQIPQVIRGLVAVHAGLDEENVEAHPVFLGGGFGRRLYGDVVVDATQIARESGLPVQLVWSREDDMRNDLYRPASVVRLEARLDDDGKLNTLNVKRAGANAYPSVVDGALPTIMPMGLARWVGRRVYDVFEHLVVDPTSTEGLYEDYDAPNKEARHVTVDTGLPVGLWRSVGHSFNGFFKEGFIDELAHHAGQDPVEFRLRNSRNDERFAAVLRLAADKGNWGSPRVSGASQGVAVHTSFYTRVAQVAEVTVEEGQIKVHRITCAVDCGLAVSPDIVRAQMEGSIVYGLTAALYGSIDVEEGQVRQSNFHDYPMLRMAETPDIEVFIVDSDEKPTGVGEPGLPPTAPAVANAVFAATGQRLRSLPLQLAT